jgi:hypothetical protein
VNTREAQFQIGGLGELLRHAKLRLGEIEAAYEADPDEDARLEGRLPMNLRTEIRRTIEAVGDAWVQPAAEDLRRVADLPNDEE